MKRVYLSLGANLGDREKNIADALAAIDKSVGVIYQKSGIYETSPWGYTDDNMYLNMAIEVHTCLNPVEIYSEIEKMEVSMGRVRQNAGYEARIIDIDILFYENEIINTPELVIPHPYIAKRRFVLEPLSDIAPEFVHPVLLKTVSLMLNDCIDNSEVKKYK